MSNYNSTLQSNNTDLQAILNTINELPNAGGEQATPVISVNSANGLITATAGTKSATHQLAFQPAKTITPTTANQTAVSSGYYTGGTVTVKGDSNLVAGNIKSGVSIFGVNGTYAGSGGGGDTSVEDGIITKTISSYTNDRVTSIGSYAFCSCYSLTTVSFPKVTYIGGSAFGYCSRLTTVSFPVAISIGVNAFYDCYSLTTVSFPKVTSIGGSAFCRCYSLTTVSFPVATSIGIYAFYSCSRLTTASFPAAITIGANAFCSCYSLTTVSFPKVTSINVNAFCNCYNLKSLYLTGSSLCKLSNSNVFTSTPIGGYSKSAGTYGSIYVPASLLTAYQTATNWTYFSSRFVGYDGGANLIIFTIDETTCQAEEGMTWAEWLLSEYNTTGLEDPVIRDVNYNEISRDTEIVAGESYSIMEEMTGPIPGLYKTGSNYGELVADWETLVESGLITVGEDGSLAHTCLSTYPAPDTGGSTTSCVMAGDLLIPDGVYSIGSCAFMNCSSLTSITIPDSVTSIGSEAFKGCSSLSSITIGSGVTSIGQYAFNYCTSLTSVTIPDSVTSIGSDAFFQCWNLTSVTIGSGVTSIGSYAFMDCSSLTSVIFKDTTTWYYTSTAGATSGGTMINANDLSNPSTAATYLKSTYRSKHWYKK